MSNGSITAHIVLDKPNHVYCGSDEVVTGNVRLRYQPGRDIPPNADLFGPLRVILQFYGRAKTKIKQDKDYYRGRVQLFAVSHLIYDGPLRISGSTPHNIPFAVHFPATVQVRAFPGFEPQDSRFDVKPDQPLPPSSRIAYSGFTKTFEGYVEYQLSGSIAMPGIKITTHNPRDTEGPHVSYERARLPAPPDPRIRFVRGTLRAQNKFLLPEADRPHGFKEKAKAAFSSSSYPVAAFSWTCSAPTQVCRGQAVPLTVCARPRVEDCSTPTLPEIRLLRCVVKITANTCTRSEVNILHCHNADGQIDLEVWSTRMPPAGDDVTATPFSEAEDWTKTFDSIKIKRSPSSFKTVNMAQVYEMHVSLTFALPGETREFKNAFPLVIFPPVRPQAQSQAQTPREALPIHRAVAGVDEDPSLPTYDDASNPPPKYTATPVSTD